MKNYFNLVIVALMLLSASSTSISQTQSAWSTMLGDYSTAQSFSNGSAFCAGSCGLLTYTTNYGATWQTAYVPSQQDINSSIILSNKTALAIGENGTVLRSRDFGASWHKIDSFTTQSLKSITQLPNGNVLLASASGKHFLSTNDGISWSEMQNSSFEVSIVAATNSALLWGVTNSVNTPLVKSVDAGATWMPVTTLPNISNDCRDCRSSKLSVKDSSLVIGFLSFILWSQDNGATWKKIKMSNFSITDTIVTSVTFIRDELVVTCKNFSVHFSISSTIAPRVIPIRRKETTHSINGVIEIADNQLLSYGAMNGIYLGNATSAQWVTRSFVPEKILNFASFYNENVGIAGLQTRLIRTIDKGATWLPEDTIRRSKWDLQLFYGADFLDSLRVIVHENTNFMYLLSNDGGATFDSSFILAGEEFANSILKIGSDSLLYLEQESVRDTGMIELHISSNTGSTWSRLRIFNEGLILEKRPHYSSIKQRVFVHTKNFPSRDDNTGEYFDAKFISVPKTLDTIITTTYANSKITSNITGNWTDGNDGKVYGTVFGFSPKRHQGYYLVSSDAGETWKEIDSTLNKGGFILFSKGAEWLYKQVGKNIYRSRNQGADFDTLRFEKNITLINVTEYDKNCAIIGGDSKRQRTLVFKEVAAPTSTDVEVQNPWLITHEINKTYPNPFSNNVTIDIISLMQFNQQSSVKVSIVSLLGEEVANLSNLVERSGDNSWRVQWTPKGIADGIYNIVVRVDGAAPLCKPIVYSR